MVLTELAAYIISQDSARILDSNLFRGIMPPEDAALPSTTTLALFEYGGKMSEPDLGYTGTPRMRLVFPLIQVMCRGLKDDYDTPRLAIQGVVTMFTAVLNQTLSGVYYLGIEAHSDPFPISRDDNFRISFVCNFTVTRQYSAT